MTYLDTSVLLAELLGEDVHPPASFWSQSLTSSRLLEYEAWNRINGRGLAKLLGDDLRTLLGGISFVELAPPVLARSLEPFPLPVRTLDALHLSSALFLREHDSALELATYDREQADAAAALGLKVVRP